MESATAINLKEEHLIEGEIAYPIYNFTATFTVNGESKEYPAWQEGLPEGRIWDGTFFRKMLKEEKSQRWLDNYIMEWWDKYISDEKNILKNIKLLSLSAKFFEYETWFCTWFQHETFDRGQTNEEALKSFQKFVLRKEILNEKQKRIDGQEAYCLMGAEDRWRWHGAEPNGDKNDHSAAPCRCKHCKEQGLIRIAH